MLNTTLIYKRERGGEGRQEAGDCDSATQQTTAE